MVSALLLVWIFVFVNKIYIATNHMKRPKFSELLWFENKKGNNKKEGIDCQTQEL